MKIVIISGSHPRHLFVIERMLETGLIGGIVLMQRENMIEETPANIDKHTKELYERHFKLRAETEDKYFERKEICDLKIDVPLLQIQREELNYYKVENFIRSVSGDCIFSYGPDLIKNNILDIVDNLAFNLHGGLSPWYKGAATMFWPFYFLEPNYVGTTLHYITCKIDAGNIIHHSVPKLEYGDCMHEVACKAVVKAADDAKIIFERIGKGEKIKSYEQKKNGKLFLEKDWRPEHLHLIYDFYEDKIVDAYLNKEINIDNEPQLISALLQKDISDQTDDKIQK